jgi:transposase
MKHMSSTILGVIGIFFLNLALNFSTSFFTEDKGSISIGPHIIVGKETFVLANISNMTREPVDGLILSIPASVKLASIKSSSPVKLESLEDSIGNQIQKRIKISGIEASRVTLLMIPIQERGEASLITPVNEHKLQFSVGPTELHPWFRDVLYKALLSWPGFDGHLKRGHDELLRRCDMGQRRRFTPEFKRQAVELLKAAQRPAAEIARELGIPRNRLYKWQKEVAAHGGAFPGSGRQAEPVAELARLKRELARVTEERDILKKAAAYFARESP